MRLRSLRVKLPLLVGVLFASALVLAGLVARSEIHHRLVSDTTANAESILGTYLQALEGGQEVLPKPDSAESTRFYYIDQTGLEISPSEFEDLVIVALEDEIPALVDTLTPDPTQFPDELTIIEIGPPVEIEAGVVTAVGEPRDVDLGSEVVAVAAPIAVGGEELSVVVSSPLKPVDDTIGTLTVAGLIIIPFLALLAAGATYLTVNRALRPVEAMRSHVERTTVQSLTDKIPPPGTGDEIDRLAVTMNDLLDRLHVSGEQQRQFISDASHELRSPITATLATIEATNADTITETWPQVAATLTTEQQRLATLVDDLLFLAHHDEHATARSPSASLNGDVDLDELALDEASRARPVPVTAHIESPQRVTGNAQLLRRCLTNLVDNAAQHAASCVDITVTTEADGRAVLRVDDDGPGIPAKDQRRIFERFTRLDPARKRTGGGAGLGLAICDAIVHQHHAQLRYQTSPSGGASFELTFPGPFDPPLPERRGR